MKPCQPFSDSSLTLFSEMVHSIEAIRSNLWEATPPVPREVVQHRIKERVTRLLRQHGPDESLSEDHIRLISLLRDTAHELELVCTQVLEG